MTDSDSDSEHGGRLRGAASAVAGAFAPGVLVRLQYASYLFFALMMCLVLKGSMGRMMSDIPYLRQGCVYVGSSSTDAPATAPPPTSGIKSVDRFEGAMDTVNHVSSAVSEYASHVCYGNTFVYRVSLSLTIFFALHFLSVSDLTCCIDDKSRAKMQQGGVCARSALLFLLNFAMLWVPNSVFVPYAWVCMIVSGIFLVVQVMLLVDFSYVWNEEWSRRAQDESGKWQWYLLIISVLGYGAGIAMSVYSFVKFTPNSDCNFHGAILVLNVAAAVMYTAVAVWVPHGSIVPSAIVFGYTSFIILSAFRIDNDPHCNALASDDTVHHGLTSSIGMTIVSSLVSAMALAYTVVSSSGADSAESLSLGGDGEANQEADAGDNADLVVDSNAAGRSRRRFDTATGNLPAYMYFYLIMIAGSMYLAMLATDWTVSGDHEQTSTNEVMSANATDTRVAVWVKIATSWLAIVMYLWSLLAPYYCCKNRDYGYDVGSDWR